MNVPVSIITITYNAERYLERTIKSVMAQEGCALGIDYEYLIVDGASTDGTLDLIRHYETGPPTVPVRRPDRAARYLTRWQSEPDRGLYDAMNKGQQLATGTFVWFMNAGDELHDPHVLRRLLDAIRANPDSDVFYSDALFVHEDGSPVGLRSEVTPHQLPQNLRWQDMAMGMKVSHQAFVARRSLAPAYPIDNLSADLDWEIRCLKTARAVTYLPFVLCRYLVGGLSVQKHRQSLLDRFKVLTWHFGLAPTIWNHIRIVWRAIM